MKTRLSVNAFALAVVSAGFSLTAAAEDELAISGNVRLASEYVLSLIHISEPTRPY